MDRNVAPTVTKDITKLSLNCHGFATVGGLTRCMNGTEAGRKRVLIIEDESDFATLLKHCLRQKGHEAIIASDGLSGLEEAARCRPDLIMLDLMLPRMGGLEVCRCIRSNLAIGHVPIWIMTALDSINHRAKGFMMGADGYFTKANQLPDLLNRIDALFAQHKADDVTTPPATTEFVASLAEEMLVGLANKPRPESCQSIPLSES